MSELRTPAVETTATSPAGPLADDQADLVELYGQLLLPRVIEEKMLALLRQGQLSKWFSGIGQEAVSVGLIAALRDDDWVVPGHRNLGVFTGRGLDLDRLFRQLLGRAGGYTAGRDRTFHFGALPHHVVGMISHLGAMVPVADGLALAARLRGEERLAAVLIGDGSTSEGDVHEAMNLAAVWALPVVFVVENNGWALSTPPAEQYACAHLVDRAAGYGMAGELVDGNDVLAVRSAVARAAERARAGDGPTLIEALTFRMRGHEEASGIDYVPVADLEAWARRDPLTRFEAVLDEHGALPAEERAALRAALRADVDRRVAAALSAPAPTSTPADELAAVHAPPAPLRRAAVRPAEAAGPPGGAEATIPSAEAAVPAAEAGVFKVTDGFLAEFGPERVRNTPIIESGALGAALGLALDGFRPVVELQFGDFFSTGFIQLVNNLATTHYRWGGAVPVIVRAPIGGGLGAGPFHSQNIEAFLCHVPGLRVVAPATPADAKGLLLAAFDDGNPVVVLEHKALYRSVRGPVPAGHVTVPLGVAAVVRPGTDATVVTYGAGVAWALAAASAVAGPDGSGPSVEVVDLRTLAPWDQATVVDSVRRTSRALVAHEAPLTCGFGADVAAVIADEAFAWLDAPVRRVAGMDTPIPFAKSLEADWSAANRVESALRDLLAF